MGFNQNSWVGRDLLFTDVKVVSRHNLASSNDCLSSTSVIIYALCWSLTAIFQVLSDRHCFVFLPLHLPLGLWTLLPFPTGISKLNKTPAASGAHWTASSSYSIWQHRKQNNHKSHSYPTPVPSSLNQLRLDGGNLILLLQIIRNVTGRTGLLSQQGEKTSRRGLTWSLLPHPAFAHSHSHSRVPVNIRGFKVEPHCLTQTSIRWL